jgi:hypothetical protein
MLSVAYWSTPGVRRRRSSRTDARSRTASGWCAIIPETSAGTDCAGSWFRLGEALENLGRIPAAVEAYQNSLVHQRRVCAQAPGENVHRASLEDRLRRLFWCHIALGQPAEAMSMARDRKGLSPGNFSACLRVAGDLAAAAVLLPADDSILTAFSSKSRRLCAVEALAAMREAARLIARKQHLAAVQP